MQTSIGVLVLTATLALPQLAFAQRQQAPVPPPVPGNIKLTSQFKPFLAGHAVGAQGYICLPTDSAVAWKPSGPQATLFDQHGEQILTHFLSPTPWTEVPNPTWQHSRDSSAVWAKMIAFSTDSNFVKPGAIPWLLLEAEVVGSGPTSGDKLLPTRRIHRVNTVGGIPPATGCTSSVDIGKRAFVPYEADYFFYKEKVVFPAE